MKGVGVHLIDSRHGRVERSRGHGQRRLLRIPLSVPLHHWIIYLIGSETRCLRRCFAAFRPAAETQESNGSRGCSPQSFPRGDLFAMRHAPVWTRSDDDFNDAQLMAMSRLSTLSNARGKGQRA